MTDKVNKDFNDILQNEGEEFLNDYFSSVLEEAKADLPALELQAALEKEKADKEKAAAEKAAEDKKNKEICYRVFSGDLSDLSNSNRLFILYGKIIRRNIDSGEWLTYSDGKWSSIGKDNDELLFLTCKVAKYIEENRPLPNITQNADGSIVRDESKEEYPKELIDFGNALLNRWKKTSKQRNAIVLLKGNATIRINQADLDKNPMLLNVKNGVVDLETGKLMQAAPELLLTKQANVIFDPAARAPVFEEFLQQILPDELTRAAVLRFLGYCLTGRINEEKSLFIWGRGGNGKGTLLQTVLKLFGSYATSFSINALLKPKFPRDGETATPELAKLEGARLAVVEEIPRGAIFDVAKFKNLTGGDEIPIRPLYQPARVIKDPMFKFIFSGNDLPRLESADDEGFNRRLLVTKFLQQFTGANADLTLKGRLAAPAEFAGIFNILLAECLAWQSKGLIQSEAMETEKETYLADNDWFSDFISECCELGAGYDISRKDLLAALKGYDSRAADGKDNDLERMFGELDGVSIEKDSRHGKYKGAKFFKGIHLIKS